MLQTHSFQLQAVRLRHLWTRLLSSPHARRTPIRPLRQGSRLVASGLVLSCLVLSRPRSEAWPHCGQSVCAVDAPPVAVHRSVHSVKVADAFHLVVSCLVLSGLEPSSVRRLTTLWTVFPRCRHSFTCRTSLRPFRQGSRRVLSCRVLFCPVFCSLQRSSVRRLATLWTVCLCLSHRLIWLEPGP